MHRALWRRHRTPLAAHLHSLAMASSTDSIQATLFARPLPPLEPGKTVYDRDLVKQISALKEHRFVIAALHLANDDIHHAHLIAQDSEGDPTADLLHATLHRREGDYWNSKYWYSRLSPHPLVPSIPSAKAFVDACERDPKSESLRQRQWDELKALVEWTRAHCK
ncbi:hypothetical protein DB88DRAFT_121391 [Papiliotrema laurentii]|uniref:Uncharacterized protein n=1 Tax=Papiliotrema laurentii TaxID=5418 RepID=A0AAD9CRY5_PAPLA|nr:hypothetical protein DB88DRAFT_121391 [Papiliotrema laurentii]